jgi:hypothetical protein
MSALWKALWSINMQLYACTHEEIIIKRAAEYGQPPIFGFSTAQPKQGSQEKRVCASLNFLSFQKVKGHFK